MTLVASSGSEVPTATMVRPITASRDAEGRVAMLDRAVDKEPCADDQNDQARRW